MDLTTRVLVPAIVLISMSPAATPQTPDLARARDEAVEILQGLIRIDTSNPPGNETKAAEYLKAILDREGIASEIVALEPDRANLVARIRGSGKKRPILLMGHTDVVGIEKEKWTIAPFGGVVQDGYIYGRGASDDKDTAASALEVLLLLHRQNLALDRDVIFLAEAGEEGTSRVGIQFMVEKHWDKIDCEFALCEGGTVHIRDGRVEYVGVATTEKVPRGMRLVARGTSGHGSMPRLDNPVVHVARAVARLGEYQAPMRLNDTTRTFFERLAAISPPEEAFLYTHLEDPALGPMVQEAIRHRNVGYNSMLRTSISPNIIRGGFRSNVIPAEAEATLDIRALPDEDMTAFAAEIRRIIDDPLLEVIPPAGARPAAPPSRLDTELFQALEKAQADMFPGATTLPLMLTGATDAAPLRARGVQAYGVGSLTTDEDRARVHGNDERISVESLGKFVELLYRAVVAVARTR